MKRLTEKEKKVLELVGEGVSRTEAVMRVFKPKNRNCASVMASRLFKKESVKNALVDSNVKVSSQLANNRMKLINVLDSVLPIQERAKILADIIRSTDKRSVLMAIDMASKMSGDYAPDRHLVLMKSEIYEDIQLLPETFDDELGEEGFGLSEPEHGNNKKSKK